MKSLRKGFERFCFKHRNKGIPNLMLFISLGSALVYIMSEFAQSDILAYWLAFNRDLILQGQVWRLVTYPFVYGIGIGWDPLLIIISLFCYYSLGRAIENAWGTFRFNLFYLCGIVLMDIYCMVFNCDVNVLYLNTSLFLAYATTYPDARFLMFFIIPVKAWIFALIDLGLTLHAVIDKSFPVFSFPENLFPLVAIANYLLFFGKDVVNILPPVWRAKIKRGAAKKSEPIIIKTIPFTNANAHKAKEPYNHRCTVCGRTDVSHPNLEFRYCSRCQGYHCYCIDHINDHTHIE